MSAEMKRHTYFQLPVSYLTDRITEAVLLFSYLGDDGLPVKLSIGPCSYCDSYIFMTPTEKRRHMAIFHHDKKGIYLKYFH